MSVSTSKLVSVRDRSLSEQLHDAVDDAGVSPFQVSIAAGLDRRIVERWYAGTRGLTLDSAEKIAAALGLQLAPKASVSPRKKKGPTLNASTPKMVDFPTEEPEPV